MLAREPIIPGTNRLFKVRNAYVFSEMQAPLLYLAIYFFFDAQVTLFFL